ncbi:hypothetical protein [Massilia sp. YIM B04103]|uniref:hypothetical protein n=1 Tax=Massilia sp. YIM B04103 TaxID=2963106 RepID=UPI00210D58C5|nr:hypothetical protein [Massilia sp. YIM B04103]
MAKFRVTIKHGDPGKYKNSSQDITVEASSEAVALELAPNKFRSSNPAYRNKEVDVVGIKEI